MLRRMNSAQQQEKRCGAEVLDSEAEVHLEFTGWIPSTTYKQERQNQEVGNHADLLSHKPIFSPNKLNQCYQIYWPWAKHLYDLSFSNMVLYHTPHKRLTKEFKWGWCLSLALWGVRMYNRWIGLAMKEKRSNAFHLPLSPSRHSSMLQS